MCAMKRQYHDVHIVASDMGITGVYFLSAVFCSLNLYDVY
jgi:hypothetical protein